MWGVELDPQTMNPKGEKKELIYADPYKYGYERIGDDNGKLPRSKEEVDACFDNFMKSQGTPVEQIPQMYIPMIRGMFTDKPYIEGAWMDKHEGRYYLQYAFAGTQYNTYGDGVYVSDKPLGPFTPAKTIHIPIIRVDLCQVPVMVLRWRIIRGICGMRLQCGSA